MCNGYDSILEHGTTTDLNLVDLEETFSKRFLLVLSEIRGEGGLCSPVFLFRRIPKTLAGFFCLYMHKLTSMHY